MNNTPNNGAYSALEDTALEWHVRLHGGMATEADWLAFTDWLEADPTHNDAYDTVVMTWAVAEDMDEEFTPEDNVKAAPTGQVIAFPMGKIRKAVTSRPWAFGGGFGAAIAATLLLLVAPVFLAQNTPAGEMIYATKIGEQRTITLADGSTVLLNTGTSIAVNMDKTSRHIELRQGEAFFTVKHEKSRSFVVAANSLNIRDIGTRFDVRLSTDGARVSVTEGIVEVKPLGTQADMQVDAPQTVRLVQGQQAIHQRDRALVVQGFDTTELMSWQDGYLVFENDNLATVVDELNRYFPKQISIADDDVAALQFSGILQIADQNRAIQDLTQFLSLAALQTDAHIVLRRNDAVQSH